jgi:hypothetical protein
MKAHDFYFHPAAGESARSQWRSYFYLPAWYKAISEYAVPPGWQQLWGHDAPVIERRDARRAAGKAAGVSQWNVSAPSWFNPLSLFPVRAAQINEIKQLKGRTNNLILNCKL